MADHEDYETGAAPAAHGPSHEAGQSDEFSVAALSGELLDAQLPKPHYISGVEHIADNLANFNAKIDDATLEDVTVLETTMDGKITAHAGLPTVHQDSPGLIETHRLLAAAHHAKYTDAEARALWSPMSIAPSSFVPYSDQYDFLSNIHNIKNRAALTAQYFMCPLIFPDGVTITKVTLYGYRDDAASTLGLILYRCTRVLTSVVMSSITANWTTGYSSRYDDSISNAVIDNVNYSYTLRLLLDPNNSVDDIRLTGVLIEFTG